jgi:subtilase family serine protease
VEAGNTPALESDLARYRDYYGLPACTTSNGCLRIVNQNGTTSLPSTEFDWSDTETPLDADMVSAMCPRCGILVVEANSESFADIETAENTAANMHPFAISNSFSATELQGANAAAFNHPGVAIFASAGDGGYATGPKTPAAFSTVIAVGGTTLLRDSSGVRGWSETAWSGSEGACSLYVAKPSWQTDTGCAMRTSADIAFSADPTARVVTYDRGGWDGLSGTSVGAPAIAALYALAGCAQSTGSFLYTYASHLFDVSSGSTDSCLSGWEEYCYNQSGNYAWNGHGGGGNNGASGSCTPSYACNAGVGYDAPTGNGTPNGLSAFQAPCATPAITPPPACTAASSSTPNPHPTQSSVVNPCTS